MQELASERQIIAAALRDLHIDSWRFEADAGARPASIASTYKEEVAVADLYIGVFCKDYGPRTIEEYEHARDLGKDRLVYAKRISAGGSRDPRLATFLDQLDEVDRGVTIRYFGSADELADVVKSDVAAWQSDTIRRAVSQAAAPFQAAPLSAKYVARPDLARRMENELLAVDEHGHLRVTRAVIHGQGGLGKSTLARAFAWSNAVRQQFRDGILWASLSGDQDSRTILSGWGRTLRDPRITAVGYADLPTAVMQLRTLLRDKACLLIVDDVWSADAIKETFLIGGPRCLLLLTSRVRAVADHVQADVVDLPEMSETEALDLFARWTGAIEEHEVSTALVLMNEVGRLPLALELMGAQVRRFGSWNEFNQRWTLFRLEALQRGRGAYGKEDSVLDSIELSVRALSEEDCRRYLRLVAIPKKARIAASTGAALWGCSEEEAHDLLLHFSDQALVTRVVAGGRAMFVLHDVLWEFLRIPVTTDSLAADHRQLVRGYRQSERWERVPDDGYLYDHLAHHLAAAGLHDELKALFADEGWMKARVVQRDSTYDGYLADVAVARRALSSEDVQSLPLAQLVRLALIPATLAVVATTYPAALIASLVDADLWTPEKALNVISLMSDADEEGPADSINERLAAINAVLRSERLSAEQRRAFQEEALRILDSVAPHPTSGAAGSCEGYTAVVGELLFRLDRAAILTTSGLMFPARQLTTAEIVASLAPLLPESEIGRALEAAVSVALSEWPEPLRSAVHHAIFRDGDDDPDAIGDEVVKAVLACNDEKIRELALIAAHDRVGTRTRSEAAAYLRAGQVVNERSARYLALLLLLDSDIDADERAAAEQQAMQAIWATQPENRGDACLTILLGSSDAMKQEIAAIAETLPQSFGSIAALAGIAMAMTGDLRERVTRKALDMLFAYTEDGDNAFFLLQVLPLLMPSLSVAQQAVMLERILSQPIASNIAHGLARAASALAEQFLNDALRAVRAVRDKSARATALTAFLSRVHGDHRRALAEEALDAAMGAEPRRRSGSLLWRLAGEFPERSATILQEALRAMSTADDAGYVTVALSRLVPFLAGAHQERIAEIALRETLRFKGGIGYSFALSNEYKFWDQAAVLAELAPYLTRAQHERALAAVAEIEEDRYRLDALAALAPQMTEASQAGLLDAVRAVKLDWARGDALALVAPFLPDAHLTDAWTIASEINDPVTSRRLRARVAVATRLVAVRRKFPIDDFLREVRSGGVWWWSDELLPFLRKLSDDVRQPFAEAFMEDILATPSPSATLLGGCAEWVSAERLDRAMEQVVSMESPYHRFRAAAAIIPHLSAANQARWIDTLTAPLAGSDEETRTIAAQYLAAWMPSDHARGSFTEVDNTALKRHVVLFRAGIQDPQTCDTLRRLLARWIDGQTRESLLSLCGDTAIWRPPVMFPEELAETADAVVQLSLEWSWM